MNASIIAKSSQEQATAAWIDFLNQLRINELMANLTQQDDNLANALQVLNELKLNIADLINSHRGGDKGVHGFIAERAQVAIENSRKLIEGLKPEYQLVDNNGSVDLYRNRVPIQQKFVRANLSTDAIVKHLQKYPDFIKGRGGKYQIPKDFYDLLQKYATMTPQQGSRLSGGDRSLYVAVQNFLKNSGISLSDIEPAAVNYGAVQKETINQTIKKEEESIKETNQKQRKQFYDESKPALQEGVKAAAASATVEGGMSFCLALAKKLKSGKKINTFTEQDWKEVGIETSKGTGKGAIRGVAIYTLTNFTVTPAAVASALVTASFGMTAQAQLLHQGLITSEEFIQNSEILCMDVTVSAIASLMGQVLIPIPVLGAVVGNAVGMFMYGISKDSLTRQEQALIVGFNEDMNRLNGMLDAHYKTFVELLRREFAKFNSIADLAFDPNVNAAFKGSVKLAQYVGCPEEKILKSKSDIDTFFLG